MKKIFKNICFALIGAGVIASCETTELDLTESPNQVAQDQLDPNFLFNNIQLSFYGFIANAADYNSFAAQATRMHAAVGGDTYDEAFVPSSFDAIWESAYADVLQDVQTLQPLAESEGLSYHLGASKVMKAYVLFTLVDLFGDVPYSEAILGNDNLNPSADDQTAVYMAALTELDEAITLLGETPSSLPEVDLFYGEGDVDEDKMPRWITAAKTLKLRALINARLNGQAINRNIATEVQALLTENDLIDTPEEDWQLNYGDNRVNPDNRHPAYALFYENNPGGSYVSNYYMWTLIGEKAVEDPRTPYYFFRQDLDATNEDNFTLQCATTATPSHFLTVTSQYSDVTASVPFCTADAARGFWGRDHLQAEGIPPDQGKRTVYGVYPAGGSFDDGSAGAVQNDGEDGLRGRGITPIITSFFTDFMKAEAVLALGLPGDALTHITNGITNSFNKVEAVSGEGPISGNTYVSYVTSQYNAASDEGKMAILAKEYYIASFGNGLEMYNFYRRTGLPSNLGPSITPNPGDFYRSALYPAAYVNRNSNANQKLRTEQIFWDTNPANFIN
ncbi:SusD/RagB family nutrient-binding outer membrane lipoprotein [Aquimarina rhabdastrellae]